MKTKAFFPCGGGSNLILGTGRKNQTIIFNTCIIFEKNKLEWKNICQGKKLVGKTIFERKKLLEKNFIGKFFLSESGGCDEHGLICIFIY